MALKYTGTADILRSSRVNAYLANTILKNDFHNCKTMWAMTRGQQYFSVLFSTAPHLSSLLPVHTGSSSTRRKSFLSWKHGEIREAGGHQHVSLTISCWTNRTALSLTAHEGKKNTRGHADSQNSVLTSTLAVLDLTLKVCHKNRKI